VSADLGDSWVPHPTADLSLRFAGSEAGPEVAGVARLERIAAGLATVRVEVFSGVDLIAVGLSSALLLGMGVIHGPDRRR
jgi:acyl-coenzyme A thioesterase PaaI-like protein